MARWFLGVSFALATGSVAACSVLTNLTDLDRPVTDAGTSDGASPDVSTPDVSQPDADAGIDASPDGDAATWTFTDNFNRADASALGNGWLEKQPVFSIAGGQVQTKPIGLDYRDEIAYRPASENLTDVTASVEVNYATTSPAWPQIHVRVQTVSVNAPATLDDYLLFPASGGTTSMIIARNRGSANYLTLTTFALASALTSGKTYRFTLSATGSSPVNLTGTVELLGPNQTWQSIASSKIQDGDVNQIATAGSVGFSMGDDATGEYTYDNFTVTGK